MITIISIVFTAEHIEFFMVKSADDLKFVHISKIY